MQRNGVATATTTTTIDMVFGGEVYVVLVEMVFVWFLKNAVDDLTVRRVLSAWLERAFLFDGQVTIII